MKRHFKSFLCVALCGLMALSTVACGKKIPLDTETRPLRLAIGALDTNFNPFFATSLGDSQIAGMTQAALLAADESGNVVCGEDWPTVALDYDKKMFDAKVGGQETTLGSEDGRTEYYFLIKKGMKFSDGKDLDIDDVLFSLYVYLDPAYTGSATIYSTDIQGLNAYRQQDPNASDDSDSSIESGFYTEARARIQTLINWATDDNSSGESDLSTDAQKDLATVKSLFAKEASTDWTSIETSWETSYEEKYNFTSAWQAYLFQEGLVSVQIEQLDTGAYVEKKGPDGKYLTTLDANEDGQVDAQHFIDEIATATTQDKIDAYVTANNCSAEYAKLQLERECAVNLVILQYTDMRYIDEVLMYWATANEALENFAGDARTKYYEDKKQNGIPLVPNISGIVASKTSTFKGKSLDGEYDMLTIKINGVDPKAIWNFAFSVSPMHYYAGETYAARANRENYFGVELGDKTFFEGVLKDTNKNGLPVGAGAYKASSATGKAPESRSEFFSNNIVYFERNTYYETMGAGINNAKIKYLNYKVTSDDKILDALINQEIDYGEPNAKSDNLTKLTNNRSYLTEHHYMTSGYGYVGINPKYVPEVQVRQAIMKSFNTSVIFQQYYNGGMATPIYRPMTTTSWAYPTDATAKYTFDPVGDEIIELIEEAGYTNIDENGKRYNDTGKYLKFTFTIAGESTDHPAYLMFLNSQELLNELGFDISVMTDMQALKKMTNGSLAVWAAAWSSGIDPDMYQVYHKDSKATSVNNWNYTEILNNPEHDNWKDENAIIQELSDKIDSARKIDYPDENLTRSERKNIYANCLDLVMDLAVEFPTYQRCDLCAYNKNVIDAKTLPSVINHNTGVLWKIWEVGYV